ncbi:MAG TPA: hypothetical protein VGR81_00305 [Candidatus Acidoferrales bacterium]|nr:hypothetical protein [Candidatus Acidoferrales bacterium]
MKLSLSRANESCFVWMFWYLGTWLLLETGSLFLGLWLFKISVHRLVGPYIALAVAPIVVGPFFDRINRRREDPPKRRARNMAIASTAFIELAVTALSYSAVKMGLVSANFAITITIVVWLFSGPLGYFVAYRTALAKIELSTRP